MTQTNLFLLLFSGMALLYAGCSSTDSRQANREPTTPPPVAVTPASEPIREPEPVEVIIPEPEAPKVEVVVEEIVTVPEPTVKGPEALTVLGFIKYVELEGGFFGIITENGTKYFPEYLEQNFKVDGLKVRVLAKPQKQIFGIQMWGTPIEILKIEAD